MEAGEGFAPDHVFCPSANRLGISCQLVTFFCSCCTWTQFWSSFYLEEKEYVLAWAQCKFCYYIFCLLMSVLHDIYQVQPRSFAQTLSPPAPSGWDNKHILYYGFIVPEKVRVKGQRSNIKGQRYGTRSSSSFFLGTCMWCYATYILQLSTCRFRSTCKY